MLRTMVFLGVVLAVAQPMQSPASAEALGGRKLAQVALPTRDLARAKAFYGEVLGLSFLFEASNMAFFDIGGMRLMIGADPALKPGGSVLYFDVPDIAAAAAQLEKRGVSFSGPAEVVQRTASFELKLREFEDPDGNHLALMASVPRR